ncbi:MAG: N-acetylmannosamine-6-phosphate 2-epimerase [Alicyclobacillus sp.]|nr:N-acetylmannosamine-6-phosphate 2-epimerase [Alicyclobacillus sp.]
MLNKLKGGLIVSCQALQDEPLYGSDIMAKMALAAKHGGAIAIRANGEADIRAIKPLGLPIIGIWKKQYPESDVYITPTMQEVDAVVRAGAEIVAVEATDRKRADALTPGAFIAEIKRQYPKVLVMADVSTLPEGIAAAEAGADLVATTMSGYTPYSPHQAEPDYALIASLVKTVAVPVIAEGRIRTPEQAVACFRQGAWAVVVGSAITRPREITRWFAQRISAETSSKLSNSRDRAVQ